MDIFGRCNGQAGGGGVVGGGSGGTSGSSGVGGSSNTPLRGTGNSGTVRITAAADSSATGSTNDTVEASGPGGRMQLTGASAPGTAASPESGVSPLADAYTKMTTDILTERTLGDFVSEHPGELVKTGILIRLLMIYNCRKYPSEIGIL